MCFEGPVLQVCKLQNAVCTYGVKNSISDENFIKGSPVTSDKNSRTIVGLYTVGIILLLYWLINVFHWLPMIDAFMMTKQNLPLPQSPVYQGLNLINDHRSLQIL